MSVMFEDNFSVLPPKQQEIWKVIWYFCKHYRCSFPSHAKIAELANCCIRTVRTAIKKFKNYGWLETTRRCYRSCIYWVTENLLRINPKDKRNYLKPTKTCENYEHGGGEVSRGKMQHDLQHIGCIPKDKATVRLNVQHTSIFKDGKYTSIRPNLQRMPFSAEDKVWIQRKFTEAEIACAAESFNSYKKTKKKPIALFWWLCNQAKTMFKGN